MYFTSEDKLQQMLVILETELAAVREDCEYECKPFVLLCEHGTIQIVHTCESDKKSKAIIEKAAGDAWVKSVLKGGRG